MNLGGIYKDLGNLDQALAATLQSLKLRPDNPNALMNLGGIYKDLGNLDQARAATLQSLELSPGNRKALKNLEGLYKEGDIPNLRLAALKAINTDPGNLMCSDFIEFLASLGEEFMLAHLSIQTDLH